MTSYVVAALYRFAPLTHLPAMKTALQKVCDDNNVCGTLLLAKEGVNGTIAGTRAGINAVLKTLRRYPGLEELEHKESRATEAPFYRMKVRIKKEIVTMGVPEADPNEIVGEYVAPKDWNDIISDPNTIVIDTRNDYEVKIGTFKNAVDPHTDNFSQFPDYVKEHFDPKKNKKVAMFCTGGIRCEKASAYMKNLGFENVYHLKGGILKYLEEVPEKDSLWQGECFVFDQRVAVTHGLKEGTHILCPSCRGPVSPADVKSKKYIEGVACPACFDALSDEKKASAAERHKQVKLAEKRGEKHIGRQFILEE
jgi:UPF0176 protein